MLGELRPRRESLFNVVAIHTWRGEFLGRQRKSHVYLWGVLMIQAWLQRRRSALTATPLPIG
ncbi:hypothetical protein [Lysobacter sp. Root690]|uniref:hypothetical protein n=1 Tax=Lysobacter sp. Root690 TaxID=1736588 RepID=UPI0006FD709E|nr:hypothetical protein [Lysobacter sp. Root690]KRB06985.1 hypothetical protein ASD86_13455 [Lysobacter sp. Root690]